MEWNKTEKTIELALDAYIKDNGGSLTEEAYDIENAWSKIITLSQQVKLMRIQQKQYFDTKDKASLIMSKKYESNVDKILSEEPQLF